MIHAVDRDWRNTTLNVGDDLSAPVTHWDTPVFTITAPPTELEQNCACFKLHHQMEWVWLLFFFHLENPDFFSLLGG